MIALAAAIAAALWLAVWLGRVRTDSTTDLTLYQHLLAGQRLVFAAALTATLVAASAGIVSIARLPDRDLARLRTPACTEQGERIACWHLDAAGQWQWEVHP